MAGCHGPQADQVPPARWHAPHLITLVRGGATFENGKLIERPE
jgi:hypothetical protein